MHLVKLLPLPHHLLLIPLPQVVLHRLLLVLPLVPLPLLFRPRQTQ
jgi:hypothetical protein